jgi:hypothetical protein
MKNKNLANYLYFTSIFGLLLSVFLAGRALAIGQITEPIDIKDALRGQEVIATLTLLNSESGEATYELKAEGQVASWASFYKIDDKKLASPITRLQIPPKSYMDATAKFSVPSDVPNGKYTGVVAVLSVPEANENNATSSSVSQRVDREVAITVSDKEVVSFDVSVIPAKYDFAEKELLKIRIIYDNSGNISIDPQIQVKIKNDNQTFYNAIFPYPENETAVRPGTQQEITALEIPTTNLAIGRYRAELDFLYKGESKLKKEFTFSIGAQNEPAGKVLGATIFDNLKNNWWLAVLAVVIILAIVAVLIFSRRAKKS